MSYDVTTLVSRKKIGSQVKKAVLLRMSSYASDDGSGVWVSKSRLALVLEMSERSVQRAIKDMVNERILIEAGKRECKNGYTVDYTINLQILKSFDDLYTPLTDVHPCQSVTPTPDTQSPLPLTECHPNNNKNNNKNNNTSSSSDDGDLDFFERVFWSKYPKKVGKKAAFKSFKSVMKQVDRGNVHYGEFMTGFEKYVSSMQGKDLQYVKHFATWLNGEHWTDEV